LKNRTKNKNSLASCEDWIHDPWFTRPMLYWLKRRRYWFLSGKSTETIRGRILTDRRNVICDLSKLENIDSNNSSYAKVYTIDLAYAHCTWEMVFVLHGQLNLWSSNNWTGVVSFIRHDASWKQKVLITKSGSTEFKLHP